MAGLNLRWRSGASAKAADSSPEARSRVSSTSVALWLIVAAITLLALTARMYNVHWDENTHAHPDERHMTLVTLDLQFPDSIGQYFDTAKSPLNPYNLKNSPSFVYGTFPVFLTKAAAELTGHNNYDDLVIVGRELTALFSAATVLFAFLAGRRLYGAAAGLIAAATAGRGAAGDPARPLFRRRFLPGVLHDRGVLLRSARHAGGAPF